MYAHRDDRSRARRRRSRNRRETIKKSRLRKRSWPRREVERVGVYPLRMSEIFHGLGLAEAGETGRLVIGGNLVGGLDLGTELRRDRWRHAEPPMNGF